MRFDVVTIFPGLFVGVFAHGIVRRAQAEGLVTIEALDLRTFAHDRHRTVDDRPFGGGEGMVLKPEPLAEALASLGIAPKNAFATQGKTAVPSTASAAADFAQDDIGRFADPGKTPVILLSAQGRPFTQALARELAGLERMVLICGRYEGVDERVNQLYCDMELSIGDYVLSGGELAAAVVIDAVMRLVPGVLGNEASGEFESFGAADAEIGAEICTGRQGVPRSQHGAGGLLDYPHYTRPAEFEGLCVPEVLLNGDHRQIRHWRREQQLRKTLLNRPDLLERAELSAQDRELLKTIRAQTNRAEG
ncbi:MAG TPA: tRNA (guanine(37)-N(1))-methyltransferase [Terracidiphilus sp.]|nr:tRNA (guanine(37)-N(1))-methyltransferase [Terracidiphilus sp.]